MITPLDSDARVVLNAIADGMLPLHRWCSAENDEGCDDRRPSRLGVVEFIERLIKQWDSPANSARLWMQRAKALEADPLRYCPADDPVFWRTERGLSASAQFGIAESGNLDTDRSEFYGQYIPFVVLCAKARLSGQPPWPDSELEKFGQELLTGNCPNWPMASNLGSKEFAKRFLVDVLAALMSMQQVGSPRPFALLEAMHEYRRIGNRYDTAYADAAVATFAHALDQALNSNP